MATETVNLKLIKPDKTDFYDILEQNDNMDKIDQAIGAKANKTDIPISLPANGGNADTLDGKHVDAFIRLANVTLDGKDLNTDAIEYNSWYGYTAATSHSPITGSYGYICRIKLPYFNWEFDTAYSTGGKMYQRMNINSKGWTSWTLYGDGGNASTLDGATRYDYLQHYRYGDGLDLTDSNYKQPYSADIPDGSVVSLSTPSWYHLIYLPHANENGHGMQIAFPLLTSSLRPQYRISIGTTWQPWRPINDNVSVQSIAPTSPQANDLWIW